MNKCNIHKTSIIYKITAIVFCLLPLFFITGCSKEAKIHKINEDTYYCGSVANMLNTSIGPKGIFFNETLNSNALKERLMYKDITSQNTVPVCIKPNCNHTLEDKDCSAIYKGTIEAAFIGKNHLYIFTSVDTNKTNVYEAQKDGSNRRLITSLHYSIQNNIKVYNNFANIPVIYKTPIDNLDAKGNVVGYHAGDEDASVTILQFDFKTNKFSKLFTPIHKSYPSLGDISYNNNDFYINLEYSVDKDTSNTEHAIYQYNSSTNKLKHKYIFERGNSCIGIMKNHVYYYTIDDNVLKIYKSDLNLENPICISKGNYSSCMKLFDGIFLSKGTNNKSSYLLNIESDQVENITNNITKKALGYSYINNEYCMVLFRDEAFECGIISYKDLISENPNYIYTGNLK